MQAQNAELRQRLRDMQAERDAAILLCNQCHKQMLDNSHVFGILSLACDGQQQKGAVAEAAAPAAPGSQAGDKQ